MNFFKIDTDKMGQHKQQPHKQFFEMIYIYSSNTILAAAKQQKKDDTQKLFICSLQWNINEMELHLDMMKSVVILFWLTHFTLLGCVCQNLAICHSLAIPKKQNSCL